MGLKRLSLLVAFAAVLSLGVVSAAPAGNFDESRMGCSGEAPATCPTGTTGQPYSIPIELLGDEDEACAVYSVSSGTLPPGLNVNSDGARIEGTPTQAGNYEFYLTVRYNREASCPFKNPSDDSFRIAINPGLAKLTIGPESTSPGTTGTPYSLQMTATVAEAKTWTVNAGTLPPGIGLNASTGLISGTPTSAGTYTFQVLARMASDSRSDTKTLSIVVRDPVSIVADEAFTFETRASTEVSASFEAMFTASGGTGTYLWSVVGTIPPGLIFADGAISGRPRIPGVYVFTITARDGEGRTATYPTRITVAPKLRVKTRRLPAGRVDKFYVRKLATLGGVKPTDWRIVRGKLPRGVFFDAPNGLLYGFPQRAGRFRTVFEATDALGVTAKKSFSIFVRKAPVKKKRS